MANFPSQESLVAQRGTLAAAQTAHELAIDTLDFVSDLRKDFAARDELYAKIDRTLFLEQKVSIPENFKNTAVEVRSPLPMHIANSIVAAMTINSPKVTFKSTEFGDVGEEAAAYRNRFFEGSWIRQQREKRRRLYRLFMHSVVTKGEGILKTHERKLRVWSKYADYTKNTADELDAKVDKGELDEDSRNRLFDAQTEEYKRGLPYPIETTEVPPETFYYQRGEDGFTRIAEVKEVPYYETLLRFGSTITESGKVISLDSGTSLGVPEEQWGRVFHGANRKTIQWVELWDVKNCTIVLRGPGDIPSAGSGNTGTGMVVKQYAHGYGNMELGVLDGPYFYAQGVVTSSRAVEKSQLSVLYAYLHLFPLLNSLLTMQSQAAFSTSYPAYRRTTPPNFGIPDSPFGLDALELQANRDKIVPGAIFPHDIAPMDQPRTSVDLDKAIQFVRGMLDMALPDAVQGVITGETAGYALNQAAHLASLQWSPIVDNVQDCLSDRVGWESRLIDEFIGETVYVRGQVPQPRRKAGPRTFKEGWLGLGPKELKGIHHYEVTLEPAGVNNESLKLRAIRDKLDMRLISPADAIKEIGGNPVEVENAWLLHEIKQDPEVRKILKQRIFMGLGTMDQQAMQALPPEAAPGGEPPVALSEMQVNVPQGVAPGISPEAFVPPFGTQPGQPPPPPAPGGGPPPPPMSMPRPSGTPTGAPGGVRGAPANHSPIPGA